MKSYFNERKKDLNKSFDELKHEPNKYLADIRRQLCFFKLHILNKDIEREQENDRINELSQSK